MAKKVRRNGHGVFRCPHCGSNRFVDRKAGVIRVGVRMGFHYPLPKRLRCGSCGRKLKAIKD